MGARFWNGGSGWPERKGINLEVSLKLKKYWKKEVTQLP